jgi:hypothetical protein
MTSDLPAPCREVARVTLITHQAQSAPALEIFAALGVPAVLVEKARCVRQRLHNRLWGLLGLERALSDSPMEIHRVTVPRSAAGHVITRIATALDLHLPGHGAIFSQDIREIGWDEPPPIVEQPETHPGVLESLTLITVIQSMVGSGEFLARVALNLGAGVPIVTLGIGTGIRDRLGLIRITIPPEKELVNLMVPSHDAVGLQSLLIEEGHLDRPGGGFLYQTPIKAGLVDPLIRIGRQEHAASIEQIIAAVDDLKRGTTWRKRYFSSEALREASASGSHCEICFVCAEGEGDGLVQAAMDAGAQGATMARVRSVASGSTPEKQMRARERGIICVLATAAPAVISALVAAAGAGPDPDWLVQTLEASHLFSHQSR